MMNKFDITKTARPSTIEVIELEDNNNGEFHTGEHWNFSILQKVTVGENKAVEEIWNLWKNLPSAKMCMRCHIPKFGLRFLSDTHEVILDASICWECHNIYIKTPQEFTYCYFKASESHSKKLLLNIKKLLENQ